MTTFAEDEPAVDSSSLEEQLRDPEARRAAVDLFHYLYYHETQRTWFNTYWMGLLVTKCPLDLWVYQELLFELRPDVIIECGTFHGGSAFYLASICDIIDHGRIYSVDIREWRELPAHPRVEFIRGSSTSADIVDEVRNRIAPGEKVLVILDSDHTKDHVARELEAYAPLVTPGSYLILEDTNINGHPALESFGEGPMEALEEFLPRHPEYEVDESCEKFFLTFNPRGYLRRLENGAVDSREEEPVEIISRTSAPSAAANVVKPQIWRLGLQIAVDQARERIAKAVGTNRDVLLLGCADDSTAAVLHANGNRIVGVEPDRAAATHAARYCDRVYVADFDGHAWMRPLAQARFDVIVAAGSLQFASNPEELLRRVRRLLKLDGYVIAAVPNASHGAARLAALGGDGDLAEPRQRAFFNRRRIEELMDASGYALRTLDPVELPFDESPVRHAAGAVPAGLTEWLSADEDARAYAFLVTAMPIRQADIATRQQVRELQSENRRLREEIRLIATGETRSKRSTVVARLRASLLQLHRHFARREAIIQELTSQNGSYRHENVWLRDQVNAAQAALAHFDALLRARNDELNILRDFIHEKNEDAIRTGASLQNALEDKIAELKKLQAIVAAAHDERADLHRTMERILRGHGHAQEEIARRDAAVKELTAAVERHRDEAAVARTNAASELEIALAEKKRAEAERDAVRRDLSRIHGSRLWRFGVLYWSLLNRLPFRRGRNVASSSTAL